MFLGSRIFLRGILTIRGFGEYEPGSIPFLLKENFWGLWPEPLHPHQFCSGTAEVVTEITLRNLDVDKSADKVDNKHFSGSLRTLFLTIELLKYE